MTDADAASTRALLLAKEAELEEQIALVTRPPQDQGSIGFGKRIGDGTPIAVERMSAVTVHDEITALLAQVRHALARLDEAAYGRCEVCDAPIPAGRLEARPWATTCIRHA